MKNHAQAILLLTGYPLEPIVALQINKSLQAQVPATAANATPAQTKNRVTNKENTAAHRFSNYK